MNQKTVVMKKLMILSAVFLTFVAAKCNKEEGFATGENFEMKIGEEANCKNCTALSLNFVGIKEDSRCPEFTNCIWEGQAVVELSINTGSKMPLELIMQKSKPELGQKVVGDYSYKLEKVDPYPKSGTSIQDEDYIITLVVEKVKS